MRFPGFIGGSAKSRSVAGVERSINLYLEPGGSKSPVGLYLTPGLSEFLTLADSPVRVLHEVNGRAFAIAGGNLYEIFSNGTSTDRGDVVSAGNASMASSHTQLIIAAGNQLYNYTLATNTLTPIADPDAAWVTFAESYFIACEPNTQTFWISGSYDGLTWNALDFSSAEARPDHLVQVEADHRELWAFGTKTIQPFYNSGAPDFPWQPVDGAMIEMGAIAGTVQLLDNSPFWVHQDSLGRGSVWRAEGYQSRRISDHTVEFALRGYADLGSAYSWSYQEEGHLFYLLTTPTATTTWCYDVASGKWHERAYWNSGSAAYERHRVRCHVYAFDKHLVGDRTSGKVYEMSVSLTDDDGDDIRFQRTAPHLQNENKKVFYSSLEILMETGATAATTLSMRKSNDGGVNWSDALTKTTGALGATKTRVRWDRLGSARDRVFEVYGLAQGRVAIYDAFLGLEAGVH